jgi:methylamine utilization protein MauE
MSRDRTAAYVLALCLLAAAVSKVVRMEASVRDLAALARGVGLGRVSGATLTWFVAALAAAELAMAAALVSTRQRRRALVAFLLLVACGIVTLGVASRWGSRGDFGCPCGLPFELPRFLNPFTAMLLRDAALVALAAIAWGPRPRAAPVAPVRPA